MSTAHAATTGGEHSAPLIRTVAGTGVAGFSGDNGLAVSAQLNCSGEVTVDRSDAVCIADAGNHRVRKVTADGKTSTVAGTGTAGFAGDDGPSASAQLNKPFGVAVDCVDTLYIADRDNNRIRRVASANTAGLPDSGTVVSWANVRSKLRMGVLRESTKDGAEMHQSLATPRDHQQWRLIPVGSVTDTPRVYEIANRNSGLHLQVDTNARTAIKQNWAQGDHRNRQWQLLPV